MPFRSTAQQRFAFGTGQPWAERWAKETDFSKLPKRVRRKPLGKRRKSFTLDQLEAFVSSDAYDPDTAGLIALNVPEIPSLKGEQIAPGITRIHGNLCNVHGKYGPCDKSLSGKKPKGGKGRAARKPAKAKLTPEQRSAQRDQEHQANRGKVLSGMGIGASDQADLEALRNGKQPAKEPARALFDQGIVEQAADGSYRLTSSGRALMNAASQGDAGRARDTVSSSQDRTSARQQRQTAAAVRQQDAATRHAQVAANREQARQARLAKQQAKQPAKSASGGGKKKQPAKPAPAKPVSTAPAKRRQSASAPAVSGSYDIGSKKPAAAKPALAPAKQIAPALQEAAQSLSDGKDLSDTDTQSLIRNGLAKLDKDGNLILTAAGMRATMKAYSFRVFKDASGKHRWVAQSSTAFQDRDQEIVSTKALAEDCAFADSTGQYGPLRWWHAPGLDLGDCDFNAMHGRVLIESGTFRTPAIAQKVAQAADGLEISLGFLHLPTEPDANGVFHHIRKFERSLVPRGKASNRFTAFRVKEIPMLDATKVAALKTLGFSDDDIAGLQAQAQATEKAAEEQQVAYKADEPAADLPDLVINGVTYKALPPSPPTAADAVVEEDAMGDMPMDEEPAGGLTLSPEDLQAISDAIQSGIAQVMGALDLEKKVGAHVAGLMAPYTAQKDASDAEKAEAIAALQASLKAAQEQQSALKAQLDELLGLQPAVVQRPSESAQTIINPWIPSDQQLLGAVKAQVPADQQFEFGDLVTNLFGNINGTPGQA